MLSVSLGYSSGGVRFDYGTRQLLCHCHHMVTEHLNFSGPALLRFKHKNKEREKRAKEPEYGIKRMLISITSNRLFMVRLFSTLDFFFLCFVTHKYRPNLQAKRKQGLLVF